MSHSDPIRACAIAAVSELTKNGQLQATSQSEKEKAAFAVFSELHQWSASRMPFGAGAEISERYVKMGLKSVREKFRTNPELHQAYGIFDPITIISLISSLFSIIGWLCRWFSGERDE